MSLLNDLFSTLDKRDLGGISNALGESEQAVSRGMQTAMGTVLGGMASKAQSPDSLRTILDMTPARDVSWSNLATGAGDPGSPLISAGKRMLSGLFGSSEGAIANAFGNETGLRSGVTSSLLAMAAPMVMGFLTRRVRDEGMSMAGLGNLLQRETPAIKAALPASLTNLIWGRERDVVATEPVIAQTVVKERSAAGWLLPLILLALIPSVLWLFHHGRRPVTVIMVPPRNTANRVVPENVPVLRGVDLHFDTGSAILRPESQARLNEFAQTLSARPDVHVTVNGYTDNVGSAAGNLKLSQDRAQAVVTDLEHKGIAADRLTAQGYGEENPIATNDTAEGRAENRRVMVGPAEH